MDNVTLYSWYDEFIGDHDGLDMWIGGGKQRIYIEFLGGWPLEVANLEDL
jgi:hypothetical protein